MKQLKEADNLWASGDKISAVSKYKVLYGGHHLTLSEKEKILPRIVECEVKLGSSDEAKRWMKRGLDDDLHVEYADDEVTKKLFAAAQTEHAEEVKRKLEEARRRLEEEEAAAKRKQEERDTVAKKKQIYREHAKILDESERRSEDGFSQLKGTERGSTERLRRITQAEIAPALAKERDRIYQELLAPFMKKHGLNDMQLNDILLEGGQNHWPGN